MSEFEVAVVGYGPVGELLAGFLGAAGVSTVVVEKDEYVYQRARTGGVDSEAMRAYQSIGMDQAIVTRSRPAGRCDFLNAEGQELMRWGISNGDLWPNGYEGVLLWHQPEIDAVIREHNRRYPGVEVRLQHEVLSADTTSGAATLEMRDNGSGDSYGLTADYVVGCDGARSAIRGAIGGEFIRLGPDNPWLVIDTVLKRPVDLPDYHYHVCDPARPLTYITFAGERRRWEFRLLPGEDAAQMERPEEIWRLLEPWIGPDDADIYRAVVYTFHSLLAVPWRRERLLIAGDAAHLMPPFLGQGLCSGIRDVRNLAWKLRAVLAGAAGEELLDTYESERSPHCREYVELSTRVGEIVDTIDPAVAADRDRRMLAGETIEEFRMSTPALGPGVHGTVTVEPEGTLFPQPFLGDGRRLDDATGEEFAVIASSELVAAVSADTQELWRAASVAVITEDTPSIRRALDAVGASAVVIRPDRYVLGVASTPADLDRLTQRIPIREVRKEAGLRVGPSTERD